jgi:dipeptidyl aminopeptidase/acylaminoacyl peptidase
MISRVLRATGGTVLVLQALLAGPTSGQVQGAPAVGMIEAVLTAPRLSPVFIPTFTPDGASVAYAVVDPARNVRFDTLSVPWYGVNSDIWVASTIENTARNITGGVGNNWAPSWSPDGQRVAFLSDRANPAAVGSTRLWVWDRSTRKLRQTADIPVLDPWARLGRLEWLGDGRTVLVKVYPEGMSPQAHRNLLTGRRPAARGRVSDGGGTARVFRSDPTNERDAPRTDPNNIDHMIGALALVDVETGSVQRLTGASRICTYSLSPDRQLVAWAVANGFERPGSYQMLVDIFILRLDSSQVRRVVAAAPLVFAYPNVPIFSWSPDSRSIAFRTDGPPGTKDQVFTVEAFRGPPTLIADGPPLQDPLYGTRVLWSGKQDVYFVRSGVLWRAKADGSGAAALGNAPRRSLYMIEQDPGKIWSPDSGRSAVLVTGDRETKRMGLARIDLGSGLVTQVLEENRWLDTARGSPPVVTPDGNAVVYVSEDQQTPSNLWLARVDQLGRPRRITRVAQWLESLPAGVARKIQWRGLDGDSLAGALIYPARYKPGVRYPLIVKVYGGTSLSDDLNRFGFASATVNNLHLYAAKGYALLLADSRLHVGTPMLDLLKTVMPGVDKAVELGVAESDRIGILGHSYGGYSVLALIVQSRRFKAAVVRAGLGDLVSAYGQLSETGTNYLLPWAEQGQGRMGGTPWEVRSRYIENSPFFYLDRVEAPVLLIHGGDDPSVRPYLADQIFTGLRRLGKSVEYARYLGENHSEEGWSLANQLDYLNRSISWFDRYLKGQAPSDP